MERMPTVMLLCFMLVWFPFPITLAENMPELLDMQIKSENASLSHNPLGNETLIGTLNPLDIEHIGTIAGASEYHIGRTDVEPSPGYEAWLPLGCTGNLYSGDCNGGYYLVGTGGSADFGSPSGTISLWLKWDLVAPHGRFWGQHYDFETRWSSNRLTLDWGTDTTIQGTKSDWIPDHWYFIAITWDETTNSICLYWGDENIAPVDDYSSTSWTGTLSGMHTENNIMNSAARTTSQVNGQVDEFRYYSVQRDLEELRSDYNSTLIGTEEGLTHYYKFEDNLEDSAGSATLVAIDDTSFSHDVFVAGEEWRAEQTEVNIRNLRRLYALNGSFDTGVAGVNVDWYGDGVYHATGWTTQREYLTTYGRQRSSYVGSGSNYISVENEGYAIGEPIDYRHYNGTRIFWYQTIANDRFVEEFDFSLNFLYQRGPIGQNFRNVFEFAFEILNGSSVLWNWSIDPTNITQRGVWYTVGPLSVDIPDAPATFEVRLSLKVNTPGDHIEIPETHADLDGDSANGQFVTILIDDVSLVGSQNPSCEEVQLAVTLEPLGTIPLFGIYGVSSLFADFKYWNSTTIPFTFSSNTSVSFEYSARVSRMTKHCNSSSITSLEDLGVAYSAQLGESIELSLFTYIESYPVVEDVGFKVYFPYDWQNASIADPFGDDVTDQSIVNSHFIEVPSGVVDSVGWWQISFDSPNYAHEISAQVLESSSYWEDETLFRSGDRFRSEVTIGTDDEILSSINDLEITWYNPLDVLWSYEVIENFNSSTHVSNTMTLGPSNSTPGIWNIVVMWSNGSEVAFSHTTFEVHHRLNVFAHTPNIEVESGKQFTAAIYVYDQDNGNPILEGVFIVGNWSTHEIVFSPNLAKSWFEADLNTSLIGTGSFVMIVSASLPFYDTTEFTINILIPSSEPLAAVAFRAGILGALAVIIFIGAFTLIRRFYVSTTTRWNLELLSLESRIEDAKNLIGVLVIHSSVGLPVYSKIIKGGFHEALLSSFISAISHFRTEFSLDEPKWIAIPITEVITAVQTESFICAAITVDSASDIQKSRLESFSLEIGGFYDHDDETTKHVLQTPKRMEQMALTFDPIFDKHFDGGLMKRYVGVKKDLPDRLLPIAKAMNAIEIDHGVSPDSIIKSVVMLGFNERRAHMMVLEALDEGYLIVAEKKLPLPPT